LQLATGGCSLTSTEKPAMTMLTNILGGGMSSRLFQSIREKNGLAYSVYSYASFYSNCGVFELYAGLSPQNTQRVCDLLRQELLKLVDGGITEKELLRAKTSSKNALYMALEDSMTMMRLLGRTLQKTNTVFNVDNYIQSFQEVTAEQIDSLARRVLCQPFASSYVGRQLDNFDAISKLKLN
ncbi:MAG: insulinase family protein, partial [Clostridia bacterium]|nr:insulinase family protein [Clostridia bacterium]